MIKRWIIISFLILVLLNVIFTLFFKTDSPVNNYLELWQILEIITIFYISSFWIFFLPKFAKYFWLCVVIGWLSCAAYAMHNLNVLNDPELIIGYVAIVISFSLPLTISMIYFKQVQSKSNGKMFMVGLVILCFVFLIIGWNSAGENFANFIVDVGTDPSKIDRNQCWKLLVTFTTRDIYNDCKNTNFEQAQKKYNEYENLIKIVKSDLYLGKVQNIDYLNKSFKLVTYDKTITFNAGLNDLKILSRSLNEIKFDDIKNGNELRVYGKIENNMYNAYQIFDDSIINK